MTSYLDHNATTPLDEAVLEAMMPYLKQGYGNPSSAHVFGRRAREAVEASRARISEASGGGRVIFTGGGSEANNLFVKGVAATLPPGRIAVSAIEHSSVSRAAAALTRSGWTLRRLAVDWQGFVDCDDCREGFEAPTAMASVMLANNETGVIQDIPRIAEQARAMKIWMHTDAVQAFGKMPVDFRALGVHAMSLSAHKIGGPKGVGALVVDKRLSLLPLVDGGGQETGLRSGTENVAGIVGFGVAASLAVSRLEARAEALLAIRLHLEKALAQMGAVLFSGGDACLPNTACFAFPGIDGPTLVVEMDRAGHAIGSGSACSSGATEPSEVLLSMGVSPEIARGAVRVSLGQGSDLAGIEAFLSSLAATLSRLRGLSALAYA